MPIPDKSIITMFVGTGNPKFKKPADKIVYVMHAVFIQQFFTPGFCGPNSKDSTWNHSEDSYALVYYTPNLMKKIDVNCRVIGNKLFADAFPPSSSSSDDHDDTLVHLEINIDDFLVETDDIRILSQYKNLDELIDCIYKGLVAKFNGSSAKKTTTTSDIPVVRLGKCMVYGVPRGNYQPYHRRSQIEETMESKFARMRLTNKKKKNVNSASVAKPYKRRSVNSNNKKKNRATAGSEDEN